MKKKGQDKIFINMVILVIVALLLFFFGKMMFNAGIIGGEQSGLFTPKEYLKEGNQHFLEEDYSQAVKSYNNAISKDKNDPIIPEAKLRLAISYAALESYGSAASSLNKLLKDHESELSAETEDVIKKMMELSVTKPYSGTFQCCSIGQFGCIKTRSICPQTNKCDRC